MDDEELQLLLVADTVELLQSIHFRAGDFRNLGLISVESRDARHEGRVLRNAAVRFVQGKGLREWLSVDHVLARKAERLAETEPELRVVVRAILLLPQVLEQFLAIRQVITIGVRAAEVLREGEDVLVVLAGIAAQRVEGK